MTVTLIDPTVGPAISERRLAARPATLDGAVIGLINNGKTHGREILERIADNLCAKYRIRDTILVTKPNSAFPAAPEQIEKLTKGATAIIGAIGD
ncbi:MAG: hypothetical protein F4125_09030 [Acidimicrobiaceae bacterium]|nr:hypothetical protein [Acidimicrobiaceae bacterium]